MRPHAATPPPQHADEPRPHRVGPRPPGPSRPRTTPPAPPVGRDFTRLPRRRRAAWVVLLGSLTALGAFSIDLYLPAFPAMRHQLHASAGMVQLTLTGMTTGLGLGQLVVGPLADAVGRRRPLLAGLAVHLVASLACAAAPSVAVLAALRLCQGAGVAAASVIALAIVRDRFDGSGAARLIARLMLVIGVSPILAPSIGGALVPVVGWRGIFLVLALLASGLGLAVAVLLPETLPPARRRPLGLRSTVAAYAGVLADPVARWLIAVAGLSMVALFGYVAGSSFVFQQQFGLSGRLYGVVFAIGGACLIAGSQVSGSLVQHVSPVALLTASLVAGSLAAVLLTVDAATGLFGLAGVLVPTWALLGAFGIGQPAAPAIALARHHQAAGTTAALLGGLQFAFAAAAAPLVGVFGGSAALGMSLVMAAGTFAALLLHLGRVRPRVLRAG